MNSRDILFWRVFANIAVQTILNFVLDVILFIIAYFIGDSFGFEGIAIFFFIIVFIKTTILINKFIEKDFNDEN